MQKNAPLIPEAAENQTDKLDQSLFTRMAASSSMTEATAWLKSQTGDALAEIIDQMAKSLPTNPLDISRGQNMREIAAASRHMAKDAQERQELAELLVIGALLNRDNPDWDPRNSQTHRPNYQDPLVQLLQTKIAD